MRATRAPASGFDSDRAATKSSTPVTVTVCATFQLAAVNVSDVTLIDPSPELLMLTGMTTFAVGWLVSTTLKVAFPPASVVTRPVVGDT